MIAPLSEGYLSTYLGMIFTPYGYHEKFEALWLPVHETHGQVYLGLTSRHRNGRFS